MIRVKIAEVTMHTNKEGARIEIALVKIPNYNSNGKKLLGFRNLQEKLQNI